MTEQKAIEFQKAFYMLLDDERAQEACEVAISALEEIQAYKKLGSIEECEKAIERQQAKKAVKQTTTINGLDLHDRPCSRQANIYLCPTCNNWLGYVGECSDKHCPECGQTIEYDLDEIEDA